MAVSHPALDQRAGHVSVVHRQHLFHFRTNLCWLIWDLNRWLSGEGSAISFAVSHQPGLFYLLEMVEVRTLDLFNVADRFMPMGNTDPWPFLQNAPFFAWLLSSASIMRLLVEQGQHMSLWEKVPPSMLFFVLNIYIYVCMYKIERMGFR